MRLIGLWSSFTQKWHADALSHKHLPGAASQTTTGHHKYGSRKCRRLRFLYIRTALFVCSFVPFSVSPSVPPQLRSQNIASASAPASPRACQDGLQKPDCLGRRELQKPCSPYTCQHLPTKASTSPSNICPVVFSTGTKGQRARSARLYPENTVQCSSREPTPHATSATTVAVTTLRDNGATDSRRLCDHNCLCKARICLPENVREAHRSNGPGNLSCGSGSSPSSPLQSLVTPNADLPAASFGQNGAAMAPPVGILHSPANPAGGICTCTKNKTAADDCLDPRTTAHQISQSTLAYGRTLFGVPKPQSSSISFLMPGHVPPVANRSIAATPSCCPARQHSCKLRGPAVPVCNKCVEKRNIPHGSYVSASQPQTPRGRQATSATLQAGPCCQYLDTAAAAKVNSHPAAPAVAPAKTYDQYQGRMDTVEPSLQERQKQLHNQLLQQVQDQLQQQLHRHLQQQLEIQVWQLQQQLQRTADPATLCAQFGPTIKPHQMLHNTMFPQAQPQYQKHVSTQPRPTLQRRIRTVLNRSACSASCSANARGLVRCRSGPLLLAPAEHSIRVASPAPIPVSAACARQQERLQSWSGEASKTKEKQLQITVRELTAR